MPEFDSSLVYLPIPSLPEKFYRVGSDGSVWSCQKRGMGAGLTSTWRELKRVPIGRDGNYLTVGTAVAGIPHRFYIHRLVLETFVGPCPEGMEGCHNDGDPWNNDVKNLRWDTPKNNQADRVKHGTTFRGSAIPWSKLKEADIPIIRERLKQGERSWVVAKDYGVSSTTIEDAGAYRTWKHV